MGSPGARRAGLETQMHRDLTSHSRTQYPSQTQFPHRWSNRTADENTRCGQEGPGKQGLLMPQIIETIFWQRAQHFNSRSKLSTPSLLDTKGNQVLSHCLVEGAVSVQASVPFLLALTSQRALGKQARNEPLV